MRPWAILFPLILLVPVLGLAQGGPPMITDDPDTPGNRRWEINTANIATFSRRQYIDQVPYLDINYGLGDHIQLKVEGGWGMAKDLDSELDSGASSLLAGVKWRFLDEKDIGVNISMYPQFDFHCAYSSKSPALAAPGNQWWLPLEFSKHFGPYAVNPEAGYLYSTRGADAWFYGVVGAYELRENFELLAELHGDTLVQGGAGDLLCNIGIRYPFSAKALLIASAGRLWKPLPGAPAQYLTYFGLQFLL